MRRLFFIFLFVPFLAFTQTKDYKSFDKAVKYFNKGKNEKAKNLIFKLIKNDPDWHQPHLLMSSILKKEGSISAAAQYLLNVYEMHNVEDLEGIQKIARLPQDWKCQDQVQSLCWFSPRLLQYLGREDSRCLLSLGCLLLLGLRYPLYGLSIFLRHKQRSMH